MDNRGESIRVMYPIFQAEQGGSTPTSPLSAKDLTIERIPYERAKDLNRKWHSRLPRLGGKFGCISFGATHGGIIYAIAIWSNPVARLLPQHEWLELRRLATSPESPRNTCSRMLRIMELLISRDDPTITRLISYQDTEVHTGGIYKAAGWDKVVMVGSQTKWHTSLCRSRPNSQSEAVKHRWEKRLKDDSTSCPNPGDPPLQPCPTTTSPTSDP